MKYADLDDKAKEKARDWLRAQAFTDSSDWDHVYSDAVEIGALMGIEIDTRVRKTVRGVAYDEPDIQFSGFSCQGDGACFSATLYAAKFAGSVARIKAEYPINETLHGIAAQAEAIHAQLAVYAVARRLDGNDVETDDYPECSADMRINIKDKDHHGFSTKMADDSLCPPEISKAINTFVDDFAYWIYKQLEAEHDYQTSDATLEENITANEYEFDEDGAVA